MENYNFFDHLSSDYDKMISLKNSIVNKKKFLLKYLDEDYKTALDLGCGTSADSIALSQLGLKVTAVDQSEGMIEKAKNNAISNKVNINFVKSNIVEYRSDKEKFDLIVSLGNTVANITKQELQVLFTNLPYSLKSNGKIIFQLINFYKLPSSGKFLLNKYSDESIEIIREYDIHNDYIDFIITKEYKADRSSERIITKIYPHSEQILRDLADDNKLKITFFGNLAKDAYIKEKSENLVAVISK